MTEQRFYELVEEKAVEILTDAIDSGNNPRCDYTDSVMVEKVLIDDMFDGGLLSEGDAEALSLHKFDA